jgi:undecaprenyl-diphosphatase
MGTLNTVWFAAIHGLSGRNVIADIAGIFFAVWVPYLLVAGFMVLLFLQKGARRRFYIFAEGALAVILARGIVTSVIRFFYHEARPFSTQSFAPLVGTGGWAFPSGHAAFFFALAMAVWYANRKWGVWYIILAALMAFARIYVGVHWPFDVIAGAAIGIASALLVRMWLAPARKGLVPENKPLDDHHPSAVPEGPRRSTTAG